VDKGAYQDLSSALCCPQETSNATTQAEMNAEDNTADNVADNTEEAPINLLLFFTILHISKKNIHLMGTKVTNKIENAKFSVHFFPFYHAF